MCTCLAFYFLITVIVPRSIVAQLENPADAIETLDWSSKNNLAIGYSLGSIQVLHSSGQVITSLNSGSSTQSIAWSPNGRKLAFANRFGEAWIWDLISSQTIPVPSTMQYVSGLAWNLNGTKLALAGKNGSGSASDNQIQIWDTTSQILSVIKIPFQDADINTVIWNPISANELATGTHSNAVAIWNVSTGDNVRLLHLPENTSVFSMAWKADGTQLAVGSDTGILTLWNTTTWQPITMIIGGTIDDLAWSRDGRLAIANFNSVKVLNTTTQQILQIFPTIMAVNAVAWSYDGNNLIYGGLEGIATTLFLPTMPAR